MKIVAVLNHKGGVGKTTFAGSIAQALALMGNRVLAIDNDSQHNLGTLLGVPVSIPGIRDVYKSKIRVAPQLFLRTIRTSPIENLHCITAHRDLCDADVPGALFLKNVIELCGLKRFYDFVIIDNPPGLDVIQGSAIYAADEIFVPTELGQFALDGVVEMDRILSERYHSTVGITKIIPNFYKDSKRQNAFLATLQELFPGKVTATIIPIDPVFDEIVTDQKILFLHRLYSKGAAFYLKLVQELFGLNHDAVWEKMVDKRKDRMSLDAKDRFTKQKNAKDQDGIGSLQMPVLD